jgi:hypothetical protein
MRIIAIFRLALLPTFAWAGTGDPGHKHKTFSAGTPGDPSKPARTVEVTMREADGSMSFVPDRIEVRQGEQIKFALKNAGTQDLVALIAAHHGARPRAGWPVQMPRSLSTCLSKLPFCPPEYLLCQMLMSSGAEFLIRHDPAKYLFIALHPMGFGLERSAGFV